MKFSTLLTTGLAAATSNAFVMSTENKATTNPELGQLDKRGCYIQCPLGNWYCEKSPYNYVCTNDGRFKKDKYDQSCENACWCSCDFTAPGIEKKDGGATAGEEATA
ncbi:hypothetical protein CKAH01_14509 [Colletotrichum kahawae]|uniref:Uncharacterized protein n=1 Tax=Colletotrichum kahawae TaxID=34407 RepID=A0AAD9YM16_COLKA|nr:hypothetical protein CKAH01_14509 [Colletotrichum kahawae]